MPKREPTPPAVAPEEPSSSARDTLFVYGKTEAGDYGVIRHRDERLELGQIRQLRDGQAIHGEVVRLQPRSEDERLFDVEVVHAPPAALSRPAQVATRAYRDNWERIFGSNEAPKGDGEPN